MMHFGGLNWLTIETAPKAKAGELVRILAAFENGRVDVVYWQINGRGKGGYWRSLAMLYVHTDRYMRKHQPTHWMPLPPPPA